MRAAIAAAVLLVTVFASVPGGRIEAAPDQAFLTQYCAGCHNPRTKRGDLVLQGLDPSQVDGRNLVVHVDCEDAPVTAGAAS